MGRLNKYELAYPSGDATCERDGSGDPALIVLFEPDHAGMIFKLKNRNDWDLFRRAWRVIRRKGSVQIVDTKYHLQAHIFAADGAMWEVTRP